MESNENSKSGENHQIILRIVTGLFSGPYLSVGLLAFLAVVVLTDYAYVLMREPAVYWLDYSREAIRSIGGFKFGPVVALGIHVIYIAFLLLVLRLLNRRISIILWSGVLILHLSTFILYPPICRYDMLEILPTWLCHFNSDVLTLIIGLIVGAVLSVSIFPSHSNSRAWKRQNLLTSIFSILWLLMLGVGISLAARIPTTGWRPLTTIHSPSPRYESMVAYDTERGTAIMFGGTVESSTNNWTKINDTWEWDGSDWTQLHPQQSPPARARGAMAYDPKRNIIILFGGWDNLGKSLSDTWIWDGQTWKQVGDCDLCIPPPSRGCHNMFYDTVREEVVLYGGCNEYQIFYNDAWGWNGNNWEYIDVQASPIASGSPMIYDSNSQWAVGFLAWQPSGTWIWDKDGWSKQVFTIEPPLRANAMMATDAVTGNNILFGGTKTENGFITFYEDTWIINGKTWIEVKDSLRPPGRWGHVIFFDTKLKKFILFGGFDGRSALNDLWEISPSTDTEK